ncbi:MAG: tRNA uridine-5-carboxymethylaminomethyl(34) synthesis enzyme MnmG [Chloroflexia bacterium]|nr:tRNA uridine-5-carboxymethylaminomethyl(34) synthesis enzyme MnmG [Chloroflexia bacterium]
MTQRDRKLHYDIIVIGAGHAGCEAALAAARAGCRTAVITTNLDRVGYMPCNPSVGGPGKSQLVAEIDALGGEMARAADRTALQVRELNASKGPAVRAVRVQSDKLLYALAMKEAMESQPNLELIQDEALELLLGHDEDGRKRAEGVLARASGALRTQVVIVTAGTFLRGKLVSGDAACSGGRAGDLADLALASSLAEVGLRLRRLKTGTPPRVDARTIDFAEIEAQSGSSSPLWMSRDGSENRLRPLTFEPPPERPWLRSYPGWRLQLACYRTSTNQSTHDLIRANLHRAPMYNGAIQGVGPRYCPSIEDKVARYLDKSSHPIFLEPEGWCSNEFYVQGMSTSLPPEVQQYVLRTIPGMRRARIVRYGYAVEYDSVDPSEITLTLEAKRIANLFLAGQVNGTSGYEEAGGQGILAGLNAACAVQNRSPVVLRREDAYIGVMVDDLVTRPFEEPYRMLTSRAEYRLLLRTDTADARLAQLAYDHGLIGRRRLDAVEAETEAISTLTKLFSTSWFNPTEKHASILCEAQIEPVNRPMTGLELLRRPNVTAPQLFAAVRGLKDGCFVGNLPSDDALSKVQTAAKYEAFIVREAREAARQRQANYRPLSEELDYARIEGLRVEARERLAQIRPRSIGQASRIAGVTPADVTVLLVHARRLQTSAQP